jgi:hypothetical protein
VAARVVVAAAAIVPWPLLSRASTCMVTSFCADSSWSSMHPY